MISRNLTRLVLGIALGLAVSAAGFAQYNGNPGMGGTGGTTPGGVYTPPKGGYSSSTGAAIGGAAAAGVVVAYLVMRSRRSTVGCVEKSGNGLKFVTNKNKKTYSLDAGSLDLKPGERVKLTGKKVKDSSGAAEFTAKKLVKEYGSCEAQAALRQPVTP